MTISGHRTWSDGSRTDYSGDLVRASGSGCCVDAVPEAFCC